MIKRWGLLGKTGCAFAGLIASPILFNRNIEGAHSNILQYKIDIEIYEGQEDISMFLDYNDYENDFS
jgi:hypothetical protein